MRYINFLLLISLSFATNTTFNPEDYRIREVYAIRLDEPLVVDGLLSEYLYSNAPVSDFIQFAPNNGERATEKTDLWI